MDMYKGMFKDLEKRAKAGDAQAQYQVGDAYLTGTFYCKQNDRKAFEWFKKSAEQGYAFAQYNLGVCYKNGNGVTKDVVKAFEWYKKSAEQGYAAAQYNLGSCYYNGAGVSVNYAESVRWAKKAAAGENKEAAKRAKELLDGLAKLGYR